MKPYERFLNYIKFDTQADPESVKCPSTEGQNELAEFLVKELKEIGIDNAYLDDKGIVYAHIGANCDKSGKKLGLIAHLDTSPDMSGKNIRPRIIEDYNGERISLNDKIFMDKVMFPVLDEKKGHDIIVTDGTTLLGADDKAGIAIIMSFIEKLINDNIKHGEISVAFTPDEEIGRGIDNFDINAFGADYAYTVDGGDINIFEYENFNAATAEVFIRGNSIHPGSAKNKMKNAILLGMAFQDMLPVFLNPAYTEKYEGFNHITEFKGRCEDAYMAYIIRNHDEKLFKEQKEFFIETAEFLNKKYGEDTFNVRIKDSYYNMRSIIENDMTAVNIAMEAMKEVGLNPVIQPIRGGTDGAKLTFRGLSCPNLGTGGYNFHGKYEFLSINEMNTAIELLICLAAKFAHSQ